MPGRRKLAKVQWAIEATPGTAVTTATAMWRGMGMIEDKLEVVFPTETIGLLSGSNRSYVSLLTAALDLESVEATFEQLPYIMAMSLGGPVTGTADGTGSSGYKYVTTLPTTAVPTNRAYTVQTGDDYEVEYITYAKCTEWTLKGAMGEGVMIQPSLIGQQVTRLAGGFTSVTAPTVEELIFGKSKLYIDAINGTAGTTQVVNQFLGFEITCNALWVPRHSGDGNLYWNYATFVGYELTGKLVLEHDAAVSGSSGAKQHWRDNTPRLMRIDITGGNYATAGTGTLFSGKKGMRLDLPVTYTAVSPLDDDEGNDTLTVEFDTRYDATYASAGTISIANESANLP